MASPNPRIDEADEAFIVAALDGNYELPTVVIDALCKANETRPAGVAPWRVIDQAKRLLHRQGKREEAKELVDAVKNVRLD